MRYRIGEPVWVHCRRPDLGIPDLGIPEGWVAGFVEAYSKAKPGLYLVDLPDYPFDQWWRPTSERPSTGDNEGQWRAREERMRPRKGPGRTNFTWQPKSVRKS